MGVVIFSYAPRLAEIQLLIAIFKGLERQPGGSPLREDDDFLLK